LSTLAMAEIHQKRGNKALAISEYDKLLALGEEELGNVQYMAVEPYVQTKGFYDNVLLRRAFALDGDSREIAAWKELAMRYPDQPGPLALLAEVYTYKKQRDLALETANQAVSKCKADSPPLACGMAMLQKLVAHSALKQYAEVLNVGDELVRSRYPFEHIATYAIHVVIALQRLDRMDDARELMLTALEVDADYRSFVANKSITGHYYDGKETDELSERLRNAAEACLLDDTCM
jgi:tetratricopeptide (TPR) repeat protein